MHSAYISWKSLNSTVFYKCIWKQNGITTSSRHLVSKLSSSSQTGQFAPGSWMMFSLSSSAVTTLLFRSALLQCGCRNLPHKEVNILVQTSRLQSYSWSCGVRWVENFKELGGCRQIYDQSHFYSWYLAQTLHSESYVRVATNLTTGVVQALHRLLQASGSRCFVTNQGDTARRIQLRPLPKVWPAALKKFDRFKWSLLPIM